MEGGEWAVGLFDGLGGAESQVPFHKRAVRTIVSWLARPSHGRRKEVQRRPTQGGPGQDRGRGTKMRRRAGMWKGGGSLGNGGRLVVQIKSRSIGPASSSPFVLTAGSSPLPSASPAQPSANASVGASTHQSFRMRLGAEACAEVYIASTSHFQGRAAAQVPRRKRR